MDVYLLRRAESYVADSLTLTRSREAGHQTFPKCYNSNEKQNSIYNHFVFILWYVV